MLLTDQNKVETKDTKRIPKKKCVAGNLDNILGVVWNLESR